MPGDEYEVIVKNLSVELVERGAGGVVARAQVMRDTLLGFSAGRRVHEITDPDGVVFVLIAWGIDPTDVVVPDFDDPDALGEVAVPEGWGYSSRIIEDDLWLDTTDTTTVVAIRGAVTSTWERRDH